MAMGRRSFTGALLATGWSCKVVAEPASKKSIREFRDEVLRLLRGRLPHAKVSTPADDMIALSSDEATETLKQIYVGNFYRRYVNGEDNFEVAAKKLVDALPAAAPPVERERIVILVRPSGYIAGSVAPGRSPEVWHKSVSDSLDYLLAIDGEKSLAFPSPKTLRAVVHDDESLWSLAVVNTQRRMGELEIKSIDEQVWTVTSPNDLGLSVMALDGFWAKPPMKVAGLPAVAAIQKNLLLVVDTSAAASFSRVRQWITSLRDDPDTMSTALLVRSRGGWKEI